MHCLHRSVCFVSDRPLPKNTPKSVSAKLCSLVSGWNFTSLGPWPWQQSCHITHAAHVLFLLSGEHTKARLRTMATQRVTDNRRGSFPHCKSQKTSLTWTGSRSVRQTQIVICLGRFLTATIRVNDTGQQNLTFFLAHEEIYLILIELLTLNSNV